MKEEAFHHREIETKKSFLDLDKPPTHRSYVFVGLAVIRRSFQVDEVVGCRHFGLRGADAQAAFFRHSHPRAPLVLISQIVAFKTRKNEFLTVSLSFFERISIRKWNELFSSGVKERFSTIRS